MPGQPEDLWGDKGLLQESKKALIEKALGAEFTHHIGNERGDLVGQSTGDSRERQEQENDPILMTAK